MEDLKSFVEKIAGGRAPADDEDFNAMDYSGGNFDDAFSLGYDEGYVGLARELLKKFF